MDNTDVMCPNYSSKDWKKINNIFGNDEDADRAGHLLYKINKNRLPTIFTPSELRDELGIPNIGTNISESAIIALDKRIKNHNIRYNSSHSVRYENESVGTSRHSSKVILKMDFFPPKYKNIYAREDKVEYNGTEIRRFVPIFDEKDFEEHKTERMSGGVTIIDGVIVDKGDNSGNRQYQLTNKRYRASENKLDSFLTNYLSKFGITVEQITDFKERFGVDGIAVSDLINKIISVSEGKVDITTLPEEASHFIVEMLGEEHPLYKSMAKNIKESKEYEEVVKEYGELYDMDEERLVKEAMGKVLAKHIISKYEGKNASVLDRIITWFKNTFKNFSKTDLEKGIDISSNIFLMANSLLSSANNCIWPKSAIISLINIS